MTLAVDQQKLYDLADTLLLQIKATDSSIEAVGELRWKAIWGEEYRLGEVCEIAVVGNRPHAVLRVHGDLWLYVSIPHKDDAMLAVIDAAKPKPFSFGRLPKKLLETVHHVREHFGKSAVAALIRTNRGAWKTVEIPAT